MRSFGLAVVVCAVIVVQVQGAERQYPDDAALRAVQFLDADVGYAVGDDGVICKTIDGGKRWELLPSNVRASLRSIHMLSHLVGWVVGREELPRGAGSVGVALCTRDGGESWQRILSNTIPGLNLVRFGDAETAVLAGDGSDQYSSGVFLTTDGGRKWRPIKGPRSVSWLGGDLLDGKTGALAGAWSQLGTFRDANIGKVDVDAFGGRHVQGMQIRQTRSFAVGEGGLVLESKTQGVGWDFAKTKLAEDLLGDWDFHAVSCVGDKVWIVGRPGSAILRSEDRGVSWIISKTGQTLPLNGVNFFDEKRGWAVGELGCILATQDGGKNWVIQRRGGQRAAALLLHARAEDVPLDTVAMLGNEQGLLTAAVRVTGPDFKSDPPCDASAGQRLAAAVRLAGGAAGEVLWQFPVPQDYLNADKTDLIRFWDRIHGDRGTQQLLRQLVLAIRIWQPDLVVTDHPDAKVTGNAASALIAEAMHEAFRQAGDPQAFPEQIEQLGLEPWRVSKVYGLWDKREGSHVTINNNREMSQLQETNAEHASLALRLLAQPPVAVPVQRYYRLLDATQASAAKDKTLLTELDFGKAGVSRRQLSAPDEPDEKISAALKAQRQLASLAANPTAGLAEAPRLLDRVDAVLAQLPDDRAAKFASDMANEFVRQGEWELARAAFLELIERYPLHPLTIDACRWLILHNSSSEARRRSELGQFLVATPRTIAAPGTKAQTDGVQQVKFFADPTQLLHWHQGSLLLGKHLTGFGPVYANEPAIQFCLQASNRRLGDTKAAQTALTAFVADCPAGPWHDVAAQELWLANPTGQPPRPVAKCRFTDTKPYLDGKFDDACWKDRKPMVLKDAIHVTAADYPTDAMLSYDEKHLYVALRCKHPAGKGVPPAKERPRDADLREFDRVSILLNLDRNYSTYFRLEVDQRGCVCEDCWGDKRWNPQWFVAVRSEEGAWYIEAAIPLSELTSDHIGRGQAWACNIVRILPGRGIQAWSTPAGAVPRPEGMGLMVFQKD